MLKKRNKIAFFRCVLMASGCQCSVSLPRGVVGCTVVFNCMRGSRVLSQGVKL